MTGWDENGKVRPFPNTSERADELLRARSRLRGDEGQGRRPVPLPVPPVPPTTATEHAHAVRSTAVEEHHGGYPVPPRRKVRPVSPRPSARELCRRDWFLAGLTLGFLAGALLTALFIWTVLLFG